MHRPALSLSLALAVLAGTAQAGAPVRDAERSFASRVTSYKALRERHIVMQQQDYTCGAASVATIAQFFWRDAISETDVLDAVFATLEPDELEDRVENGLAITDLRDAAEEFGYDGQVSDLTFAELTGSKVPLIVPIKVQGHDHFAVYRGFDGFYVYLADPLRGNVRTSAREFVGQWQQNAALVLDNPDKDIPKVSPLSVIRREVVRGETTEQYLRGVVTPPRTQTAPIRTTP